MDFDNLVPFGQLAATGEFADVGDVRNGSACGCICPSCRTPLVARQGDVKAWHFAHASRGAYDQTVDECSYSFEVSARLMALQLLRNGMTMAIPDCYGTLDGEDFDVAPEQSVSLNGLTIETQFSGVAVDAVARVNGAPFVIYLTHFARPVPEQLRAPADPTASIISIDVSGLRQAFAEGHATGKRYTGILATFLSSNNASKTWLFHPDLPRKRALAMEQQAARPPKPSYATPPMFGRANPNDPFSAACLAAITRPRVARSWCVNCKVEWDTPTTGFNRCPRCRSDRHISAL